MRYALIADVLATSVNISNKVLAFKYPFLIQNIFFMSFVTKLALAIVKQKIDTIVNYSYFKLPINNITLFILEKSLLEKIERNIKADIPFFHHLIREISAIK